jgi:type IV secretion system protein VirD4
MRPRSRRHSDSRLPWIAAAGGVLVVVGWLVGGVPDRHVSVAGPWLITAGVLMLVTAAAVAWSTTGGVMVAGGLWLLAGGWFLHGLPGDTEYRGCWPLVMLAGLLLVFVGVPAMRHGRGMSRGLVQRWAARTSRNDGVASNWQILRHASRSPVRRKAKVLRPSVAEATAWQRRRIPTTQYATPLVRVGLLTVWSPVEDVTVIIAGPRQGKSGAMAGRILDAPGAVIATSTRTDLIELTSRVRERRGPVHVFNPAGLGGERFASTISFDPLSGCEQPKAANDRAADLLAGASSPGKDSGDREFWASQARRVLAALLHAAALGQLSMREVLIWVSDPDRATGEVQRLLRRSVEPNYETDALQFLNTNDRTRSSITATMMPALSWMTDPTAEHAAREGSFDVARLLDECGTVYMLGAEDAQTAPLVTALTGHIAREARRIAGLQPSGRLDPPLTLALDEAALICPVPLDQWTSDMGGRNITIHIAAQSRAQLRARFGDAGAAAILNNAATVLIGGGTKDPDDLAAYAALTGDREEEVATYDEARRVVSTTTRRVPVMSSAQIAQLPPGRVLILLRGMPVAVGRLQMAWKRRDVRALATQDRLDELGVQWQRLRAWATVHLEEAAQWTVARLVRAADRIQRIRTERAWRRMRPPVEPTRIEAIEREPTTAQVIALPQRPRPGDEEDDS